MLFYFIFNSSQIFHDMYVALLYQFKTTLNTYTQYLYASLSPPKIQLKVFLSLFAPFPFPFSPCLSSSHSFSPFLSLPSIPSLLFYLNRGWQYNCVCMLFSNILDNFALLKKCTWYNLSFEYIMKKNIQCNPVFCSWSTQISPLPLFSKTSGDFIFLFSCLF